MAHLKPSKVSLIKRKLSKYLPLIKIGVFFSLFLIVVLFFLSAVKFISSVFSSVKVSPINVYSAMFKNESNLKQKDGRINILLLGTGDGNHDGPNLTDTMIFLSIDPLKKDIFTLPIPRDIWSDELKDKINSAYAYGEEKKPGGGLILSKAVVSEITGMPIHYAIRINFSSFEKLIDLLGGIDINVENTLVDEKFPIVGKENEICPEEDKENKCRYETIRFGKGMQHMGGITALNFVRSRYANGMEGTDFARSKRQINVIKAIRAKAFSLKTITDQKLVSSLIDTVMKSIDTDITQEEAVIIAKTALKFKDSEIRRGVLDWGDTKDNKPGLLVNPPPDKYDGAWVLIPKSNNWKEVHDYVKNEVFSFTEPTPSPQ